jgi:hypothetical protein
LEFVEAVMTSDVVVASAELTQPAGFESVAGVEPVIAVVEHLVGF